MATISGEIRDENNDLLADCVVRAYRRDTGALLVAGLSGDGSEEEPGDADYASVSLLLHCDGTDGSTTFTDTSPTPKTITVYGNAHIETDQSKFGGASAYFDGTEDYLSAGTSSGYNFGSGDMTVELWFRTTQTTDGATLINREWVSSPWSGGWTFQLRGGNTGPLRVWMADYNTGAPLMTGITTTHGDGQWHHAAWTKQGNVHRLFLDGVQEATVTTAAVFSDVTKNLSIGSDQTFGGRYFNGYLDEIRITKGVARYTADFTPPTDAFLGYAVVPAKPLGEYTLTTAYTGEVNVIALDPSGGTAFNDLILRTTPV